MKGSCMSQNKKKLKKSRDVAPWPTGMLLGRRAYEGQMAWIMRDTKTPPLLCQLCVTYRWGQGGEIGRRSSCQGSLGIHRSYCEYTILRLGMAWNRCFGI